LGIRPSSNRIIKMQFCTVLSDKTDRNLFFAQIISLIGTAIATVAIDLFAYNLAGANAAIVLGTIFKLKMTAYGHPCYVSYFFGSINADPDWINGS